MNKIQTGDTVEVYVPMFSTTPTIEIVKEVKDGWVYFEGDSGRIQTEYCTKREDVKTKKVAG